MVVLGEPDARLLTRVGNSHNYSILGSILSSALAHQGFKPSPGNT